MRGPWTRGRLRNIERKLDLIAAELDQIGGQMADWNQLKQAISDLQASNQALRDALTAARDASAAGDQSALDAAFDSIEAEISKNTDTIHPAIAAAVPEATGTVPPTQSENPATAVPATAVAPTAQGNPAT